MTERTSPRAWHFAKTDKSPVSECQFQRDRAPFGLFFDWLSFFPYAQAPKRAASKERAYTLPLTHSTIHSNGGGLRKAGGVQRLFAVIYGYVFPAKITNLAYESPTHSYS